ncbi:MAG: choice-of-anchor J domain-containing protein [Bacteroidota bacterium]
MKKITTHAFVFLLLVSTAMAGSQYGKKNNGTTRHGQGNSILTVPFFTEDFGSGFPASWQNIDNGSPANVLWRYTTTGAMNGFPFANALSSVGTTAGNGYMVFDSDSAAASGGEDASIVTVAIDCSAKTNVHLTFNEYFAQFSTSQGIVWVSNDSSTWTDIHHAEAGLGTDQTTANPFAQDIDISTFAAGQATVYIQFEWIGEFEYFWMIDDIALYEIAATDGGVTAISAPVSSCALLSATEPVTVEITNFATIEMSAFEVTFVADGGSVNTEMITDTIAPGGTMIYTFTATADLSMPGAHNILAYTTVAGDADNSNDQIAIDLYSGPHVVDQVTHYMQGFEPTEDQTGWTSLDVDADAVTWGLSGILPRTGAVGASYVHELPTNQANDYFFSTCLGLDAANVYQLDFYYRNFSPAYQSNMEVILCTDQDPATVVATLVPTMLVNTSIWTLSSSTIYIPGAASGNYYIGWHVTQQDSATSLKLDDIDIYYSGPNSLPAINSAALTIYPNPTSGMVSVRGIKELTEITVYDMLGNVVLAQTATASTMALDLRSQPQGVYSVVMRAEKSVTTKQLIITGK